jgi:carboxyl-terminal processing protease
MQSNSKYNYAMPVILALCISAGLYVGHLLSSGPSHIYSSGGAGQIQKMQDIVDVLDLKYVDSINRDELFEQTISAMLHKLDPHSNYISAKEMQRVNESMQGNFGGVGVRFFILRDTICITNVISGSPSDLAGLKAGDKIIKVDGKTVAKKKITNDKVMSLLKGKENTSVHLQILRKGKLIEKEVIRGTIPIESVICAYMIKPGIGFIKIEQFSLTTTKEFRKAAKLLKQKGMKKMILDLRDNGGGILESATDIADEFLKNGLPMLITKGKSIKDKTYLSSSGGMLENIGLTILINESSASASEIVAGAIQDNDRGTIIGRRSFGKGLVGQDFTLRDGSNLRLTIARYYTPTLRSIQKPYTEGYEDYMKDQVDRYDNGELFAPDSSLFVDSLKYKTPKGKIVYGGGGIMPDIFVPLDSSGSSWYFTELRFSQAFHAFAFDYVQNKRDKWSSFEEFDRDFQVNSYLLDQFIKFSETEIKIKKENKDFLHSKALITKSIKAEIARQLWLEDGYYRIINKSDNEVQKALSNIGN